MSEDKRVVLVTGASSGIGKATAEMLARQGYMVYGAARRLGAMEGLQAFGGVALQVDVTDEEGLREAVDRIISERGHIDVLINNAGFGLYGSVEDTPLADARYQMEVNIFGLARLTQLVIPHMRKRRCGTIVNISSMGGRMYTPLGAWYHATKHALEGFSDCLRLEVAPFGIKVIVVQPGAIKTGFGDVMLDPMLRRSSAGPYSPLASSIAQAYRQLEEAGAGSPPELIARTITRALQSSSPRTRYVSGKFARPMMAIRRWLGDRFFDRMIMSRMSTTTTGTQAEVPSQ